MSVLEIKGLENNFENWRKERGPDLAADVAFERYTVELILKDADLSDEDISSVLVGGGDDGGIDGVFFFVNRQLMSEEAKLPDQVIDVQLWIIQAKYEPGFGETPVEKIQLFMDDLLNFEKPVDSLNYYNQRVKDASVCFGTSTKRSLVSHTRLHSILLTPQRVIRIPTPKSLSGSKILRSLSNRHDLSQH